MNRPPNRTPLRASAFGLAAATACLLLPASAAASEVQVVEGLLRVGGFGGERNQIELRYKRNSAQVPGDPPGRFVVADKAGAVPASPECVAINEATVTCGVGKISSVSVVLGDLDDEFLVDASGGTAVPTGFPIVVQGGGGDDVITGGGGRDALHGQGGRDVLAGAGGADRLFGGKAVDALLGLNGPDRMLGGGGNDVLLGQPGIDSMWGGKGGDYLDARDEKADRRIDCGSGKADSARRDSVDPKPHSC